MKHRTAVVGDSAAQHVQLVRHDAKLGKATICPF